MDHDDQLLRLVPGRKAVVHSCQAREHGNNAGCVCHLKGLEITLCQRYETIFAGTPTWHIEGHEQRVRLEEIVFTLQEQERT